MLDWALALAAKVDAAAAARASGDDRLVRLGRYRLVRTIGRGGMGQVFEAWDPQLERHVALKLALRGGPRAPLEEARCLARLAHPNVVSVHEVGEVDGRGYIAMELVDGPNLRRWLQTGPGGRRRSWREIVEVVLAAGRGLAAVHDAGLLHGDVKPSNVLVGRDGRVRVADFGLARIGSPLDVRRDVRRGARAGEPTDERDLVELDELDEIVRGALAAVDGELDELRGELDEPTLAELRALLSASSRRGAFRGGTVPYMAPERLAGGAGGPAADQFSLCLTAWEALFDEIPVGGWGSGSGLLSKLFGRRCPAAVIAVLRRGLEPCPDDRWPSIHALCSALEQARDQPERMAGRMRRFASLAAVTGSTIGLAFGSVGMSSADPTAECERAAEEVGASWGPEQRSAMERRFIASDLPLPRSEARFVAGRLDAWVADWTTMWSRACATQPDVRRCLERERARFEAVLELIGSGPEGPRASLDLGDEAAGAARALVTELGSPVRCLDPDLRMEGPDLQMQGPELEGLARLGLVSGWGDGLGGVAELAAIERRIELAVWAGAYERAAVLLAEFDAMVARAEGAPEKLALQRLAVEPYRARVLAATGEFDLARARLRLGVREAEARGHDGIRFALLLEQSRLPTRFSAASTVGEDSMIRIGPDELAVLEGLAERVQPGPVERAELLLVRAAMPPEQLADDRRADHATLVAELAAAGAALAPEGSSSARYAELRFELALRRARLHFDAGELHEASNAAEQAWAISREAWGDEPSHASHAASQEFRALRIVGLSAALRGDCRRAGSSVEVLRRFSAAPDAYDYDSNVGSAVWRAVLETCPYAGGDLFALLGPKLDPSR